MPLQRVRTVLHWPARAWLEHFLTYGSVDVQQFHITSHKGRVIVFSSLDAPNVIGAAVVGPLAAAVRVVAFGAVTPALDACSHRAAEDVSRRPGTSLASLPRPGLMSDAGTCQGAKVEDSRYPTCGRS